MASGKTDAAAAGRGGFRLTSAFTAVFFVIVITGLAATAYILNRPLPQVAPPQGAPSAQSTQSASSKNGSGELPAGHPKLELPTEARTFIDQVEKEAEAKPNDVAAWVKLGTVSMRAALFDESYYAKAADAFARALKLDPENLDALRGMGDVDYDRRKYDEATAAYEHYLKNKPNDPEVIVDLGTMYLYTGNADQAIVQYKKGIALKPNFFQAYYNLGIAYGEQNDKRSAEAALYKAIAIASDDDKRKAASDLFTRIIGQPPDNAIVTASRATPAPAATSAASTPKPKLAAASTPKPKPSAAPTPKGVPFQRAFEKMVRDLPVAGEKVNEIQWTGKYTARVLMDDFPMDSMPPFAKDRFLSDLKAGIDSAKTAHKVTRKVEVDIVDADTGRVMETVNE